VEFNQLSVVLHGCSLVSARKHTKGWTISKVIHQSLTLHMALF